jgi:hypothetical protein
MYFLVFNDVFSISMSSGEGQQSWWQKTGLAGPGACGDLPSHSFSFGININNKTEQQIRHT